jgi:hypothetical protein
MFWALGAIFLQLHAVPQAAVPAVKATTEQMQIEQASDNRLILADASSTDDIGPLEPGRLTLMPVSSPASAAAPAVPAPAAAFVTPIISTSKKQKPEFAGKVSEGSVRAWKGLAFAQHSAAVFDAWSTRRALDRGAHELNPMLKPFAGNASIYAAAQVGPTLLDFLSHKMMTSSHAVLRKTWWIPQILGATASVTAGLNNIQMR